MSAVLLGPKDPPQKVQLGNYTLQVAFWPIRYTMPLLDAWGTTAGKPAPRGGDLHCGGARRVLSPSAAA